MDVISHSGHPAHEWWHECFQIYITVSLKPYEEIFGKYIQYRQGFVEKPDHPLF
jgi:hypothetical protein